MLRGLLIFTVLTILPFSARADGVNAVWTEAQRQKLWLNDGWIKLGHYQESMWPRSIWRQHVSDVDGSNFFLSPEGKRNPQAELRATLEGFFSDAIPPMERVGQNQGDPQHPQCRFPARLEFLEKHLKLTTHGMKKQSCPRLDTWLANIAPHSVTFIFSSYYLNNPSSAFGHVLLRLNKEADARSGQRYELLDYGVNFAATVGGENPIVYAFKGLLGLFDGNFTMIPYYYKVREYNDFEARDLWEYELNFTREETFFLTKHLWELGATTIDYWYLDENCAVHLLTAMDAVRPALNLQDNVPSLVVVPSDSVKVMGLVPGLVRAIKYRPSVRKQFEARLRDLPREQHMHIERLVASEKYTDEERSSLAGLTSEQKARVLDAAIDYVDYKFAKELLVKDENSQKPAQWKHALLIDRSALGTVSGDIQVTTPYNEDPSQGHGSTRTGVSFGASSTASLLGLHYRTALRDLVDPVVGYPDEAQIEFLNTNILLSRHMQEKKWRVELDHFSFVRVLSLNDYTFYNKKPSWTMHVGARTVRESTCNGCLAGFFQGGIGITNKVSTRLFDATLYALALGEFSVSPDFPDAWARIDLGPIVGWRARLSEQFAALLTLNYRYRPPPLVRFAETHVVFAQMNVRWELKKNWALDVDIRKHPKPWDARVGVYYYY